MLLNDYQKEALSYRLPSAADPHYALLNLSGEVGELHSLIAKGIRDGKKPDHRDNVAKELGDILWMVAAIAADNSMSLNDVASLNLSKLFNRKVNNTISGSGDNR